MAMGASFCEELTPRGGFWEGTVALIGDGALLDLEGEVDCDNAGEKTGESSVDGEGLMTGEAVNWNWNWKKLLSR